MTDTINVPVVKANGWTAVQTAAGAETGSVSIAKGGQHCTHTGAPATTLVGHRFTGDMVPFSLVLGESLYVKPDEDTVVIITED